MKRGDAQSIDDDSNSRRRRKTTTLEVTGVCVFCVGSCFLSFFFVSFVFCVFSLSFSSLLLLSFYWLSAALLPLFDL